MEDVVAEEAGRKVVYEELAMILLDGHYHCGAVRQLEMEGGHT